MDIVATTDRHPKVGETLSGDSLSYFPGGKGANQAVAAANLGTTTNMVGRVGDDASGRTSLDFLTAQGVDVSKVSKIENESTGTAIIVVADGDNTIVVIPGANSWPVDYHPELEELTLGDSVLAQFETPVKQTKLGFMMASADRCTYVFESSPCGNSGRRITCAHRLLNRK